MQAPIPLLTTIVALVPLVAAPAAADVPPP